MKGANVDREQNRREFLKRVAALSIGAGVIGMVDVIPAFGQEKQKKLVVHGGLAFNEEQIASMRGTDKAFAETLNEALDIQNMKAAIDKYGKELGTSDRSILMKIDAADLKALKGIIQKIGISMKRKVSGISGGVIF